MTNVNENNEGNNTDKDIILYFETYKTKYSVNKNKEEYYCNDQTIKFEESSEDKEENKDEREIIFTKKIKESLYSFCKQFERIVVLAGAGTSMIDKGIVKDEPDKMSKKYKYGYSMSDLSQYIKKELSADKNCYDLNTACEICKYNKDNNEVNIEDFLSQYESFESFVEDKEKHKYENTKKKIYDIIQNRTKYNLDNNVHIHEKFIKILSDMHKAPNRLTIVTTNYDTLFEEAASNNGFTVIDGFDFASKPKFDVDIYNWSLSKPIEGFKTEKIEYKKNVVNLVKLHGSLTFTKDGDDIIKVNKNNCKSPLMIFPGNSKFSKSYDKPYFELFNVFQEMLHKPHTLLVTIGFSFSDKHIVSMIEQAIKINTSLSVLIISPNIDDISNGNSSFNVFYRLMVNAYSIAFLKSKFDNSLINYLIRGDEMRYENR